jgi:hypothetical protein
MRRTITIPADVVPLVYSGLQLDIWQGVMPELDELFLRPGRAEHPEWFERPFRRFHRIRELLDLIDWPRAELPADIEVEFEPHREILLSALRTELQAQRDLRDSNENAGLLEESLWAVILIEDFLAGLPEVEAEAEVSL